MRRVGQVRKRDANEGEIVDALKNIGCSVFPLHTPGLGDLLVFAIDKGGNYPVGKPRSTG